MSTVLMAPTSTSQYPQPPFPVTMPHPNPPTPCPNWTAANLGPYMTHTQQCGGASGAHIGMNGGVTAQPLSASARKRRMADDDGDNLVEMEVVPRKRIRTVDESGMPVEPTAAIVSTPAPSFTTNFRKRHDRDDDDLDPDRPFSGNSLAHHFKRARVNRDHADDDEIVSQPKPFDDEEDVTPICLVPVDHPTVSFPPTPSASSSSSTVIPFRRRGGAPVIGNVVPPAGGAPSAVDLSTIDMSRMTNEERRRWWEWARLRSAASDKIGRVAPEADVARWLKGKGFGLEDEQGDDGAVVVWKPNWWDGLIVGDYGGEYNGGEGEDRDSMDVGAASLRIVEIDDVEEGGNERMELD
ncbi:hypothetical protein HK101_003804 [Irineochytrium annulatum]|nr:hypothetical protein HK101_003804 [Irineochytrium annulatum]